jgi:putative heme-binding domain-containing protein
VESLGEAWLAADGNLRLVILDLLEGMGKDSRENFTGILRDKDARQITTDGIMSPVILLLAARTAGADVQEQLRKMALAFLEDAKGDLVELLQEQKPKASEAEKAQDLAMLRMEVLRAYQISLIRHGRLPCDAELGVRLAKFYPGADFAWNRELSQLLVAVKAPGMVGPTLDLQTQAVARWETAGRPAPEPLRLGPQEEQIWYARVLCDAEAAQFTVEQRDRYFAWFAETAPQLKGANNFIKYLESIRQRALSKLTVEERKQREKNHQAALLARQKPSDPGNAPVRKFVKMWTLADLEAELGAVKAGRNFERGKEIFTSLLCAKCHLFNGGTGAAVGPDLTAVGGRFAARDILEAITDPSKVISEQYAATVVETREDSHMGLIAGEDSESLTLYADAYGESKKTIPKKNIIKREPARISLMPMGLLGSLEKEEIWDLLAYMISGGKKDAENFRATP